MLDLQYMEEWPKSEFQDENKAKQKKNKFQGPQYLQLINPTSQIASTFIFYSFYRIFVLPISVNLSFHRWPLHRESLEELPSISLDYRVFLQKRFSTLKLRDRLLAPWNLVKIFLLIGWAIWKSYLSSSHCTFSPFF